MEDKKNINEDISANEKATEKEMPENVRELIKKGMKFDIISDDYARLKGLASDEGQSVSELLTALEGKRLDKRKSELTEKCGGNGEMAEYILGLEGASRDTTGFDELKKEFPEIKVLEELPGSVIEKAELRGTRLLDEYLRYLHNLQKNADKALKNSLLADKMSIGSQTDRSGGINPETVEFLKGLWK